MNDLTTFKRYELKYLLTREQRETLLRVMEPYMTPDSHGRTTVRNVYFDTDTFRLARRSIEKPVYKEKLRVRGYRATARDEAVFVELKKKYRSVVYKRRLIVPQAQAFECLAGESRFPAHEQVAEEIEYFRAYYRTLRPVIFLSYDREAFFTPDGAVRITLDRDIRFRTEALSLSEGVWGTPLLTPDTTLMEIKTALGMPLWMTRFLSERRLYRTSFSKYGQAYEKTVLARIKGDVLYA